jgi:hypothetical protein
MIHPHHGEHWLAWDFQWLSVCDALVRLPGESKGADREVAFCAERGVPVFHGMGAVPAADTFIQDTAPIVVSEAACVVTTSTCGSKAPIR